jgi:hypothetical protein
LIEIKKWELDCEKPSLRVGGGFDLRSGHAWVDLMLYNRRTSALSFRRGDIFGRDAMIKLSNYDGRFVVRLLELRRAAILEMMQQLPEQSGQERAAELKCLDAVLTQIKGAPSDHRS